MPTIRIELTDTARLIKLDAIEKIVRELHNALDRREHGGAARDEAIHKIETVLGLRWVTPT